MDESLGPTLEEAVREASAWLDLDGVEGVAESEVAGEPCILVLTSDEAGELAAALPERFSGFAVVVRRKRGLRSM